MKRLKWLWWVIGAVVILVVGVLIYTFRYQLAPYVSWWVEVLRYWLIDLDLISLGPAVILALAGLTEFILAIVISRRGRAFDNERAATERLHQRELELLQHKVDFLTEEGDALRGRLRQKESLIQEERQLLYARLEQAQIALGLSVEVMVELNLLPVATGAVAEIEQVLQRLERIESVAEAVGERSERDEGSKALWADDLLKLGNSYYNL
ncbi:MAG: hypothetical protein SVX38_00935, partial [Chloroflexota bacterium]|nr:hypothetical protein [Chloroflexota bacterium]